MGSNSKDTGPITIDPETVYSILGNPNKRNIIIFLGERGVATFTEMRKNLRISVGNLYYNLDGLKDFITKDEKRRYMLTERGKKLYQILREEASRIDHAIRPKGHLYSLFDKVIRPIILPERLFISMYRNKVLSSIFFISVSILAILSATFGRFELLLLEYGDSPVNTPPIYLGGFLVPVEIWLVAKVYLSWILITILLEALCRIMGIREFRIEFAVATFLSYAPILAYPILYRFIVTALTALTVEQQLMLSLLFRLMQAFTLGFLTAAISVFKRMTPDKAFILVFVLFYVSYLIEILL